MKKIVFSALLFCFAAPSASAQSRAKYEPSGDRVYHGASVPQTWNDAGLRTQVQEYQRYAGKKLSVVTWFASAYEKGSLSLWTNNYAMPLQRVKKAGAVSLIKFSVQDYVYSKTKAIADTRRIARGEFDAYFEDAADAVKRFGGPVFISVNHEMNGTWYPYSEAYKKGATMTADDFIASWKRIVDVFRRKGANNVAWVWSPNVPDVGGVPFSKYYPGDDYVDWVGVSLYSGEAITGLDKIYKAYAARKPFFVTEWATGPDKSKHNRNFPGEAKWIDEFFKGIEKNYPRVKAISWFHWNKSEDHEDDYRLQRVPEQAAVYQSDVSNARYVDKADDLIMIAPGDDVPLQVVPREVILREVAAREAAPVARPRPSTPTVEPVRTERPRLQIVPREKVLQER